MINHVETPFNKSIVLVCSTCSKQFSGDLAQTSDRIKSELKIMAKEKFGKVVRVVNTSCQGICPKNAVAVTSVDLVKGDHFSLEVDPLIESSFLFEKLFKDLV